LIVAKNLTLRFLRGLTLDALFHWLPDELVDLEGEAGVDAIGHHPFDECAWVEGGVVGGAEGAGGFVEGWAEEDTASLFV
jgi:hypothetical protein